MFLVLGYGNSLREDDGAGRTVVEGLEGAGDDVRSESLHQLAPELADLIAEADGVVFVDADSRIAAGEVRCEPVGGGRTSLPASHSVGPDALLELTRALHGRRPPAVLVTVGARSFGLGEGLSPEVAAAVPAARARILETLAGWREAPRRDGDPRGA